MLSLTARGRGDDGRPDARELRVRAIALRSNLEMTRRRLEKKTRPLRPPGALAGRVAVLSPHPDDAALSLGATISATTRVGAEVVVVSAFACDPGAEAPASDWDRRCGFASAGEAAAARRQEDLRACALLGASLVSLPFPNGDYASERDGDEVWTAIESATVASETLLVPGAPLLHSDHLWLTLLALERRRPTVRVGFYVEQPYAFWEAVGGLRLSERLAVRAGQALRTAKAQRRQRPVAPAAVAERAGAVRWHVAPGAPIDRLAKLRAVRAYRSQLRGFGRLFVPQIALYEWSAGGEAIGWPTSGASYDASSDE
jgi:LmbE family N-acetylglucosaminyl deacetylase